MTVRELLSMGKNVNYGATEVSIFDTNGGWLRGHPSELPEKVKDAHVMEYTIHGFKGNWIAQMWIIIAEVHVL